MRFSQRTATTVRSGALAWWLPRLLVACCLAAAPAIAPLAAPPPSQSAAAKSGEASQPTPLLILGVGDAVSVKVYGRPELATTTYVSDDGSIPVPLAGDVQIAGQSPSKAAQSIAAAFRQRDLLVNPQVTVFLVESRSQQVSVLGAVAEPGRFVVTSNTTVLDVLAQAGGITEDGGNTVVVMRPDESGQPTRHTVNLQGFGQQNQDTPALTLRGGDSIFVPPAERFSIYGEVNQPNIYRLKPGMTVVEAITRGGGVTPRGSRNRIEIRRANGNGTFTTRDASLNDVVKPDDVIRIKGRLF